MNPPTPAIVSQQAVRRLPRLALLLLCAAYVLPGFVGREPWKNADMAALGYMFELAQGATGWFNPLLLDQPPAFDALLPYWLGAWAMMLAPPWLPPDLAARLPFIGLLVLTLGCTWYGVYHLARSPAAQPVPFAFGGEASATDYARAMADGALLALIASLGLAQLSHETTPSLAQLACTSLSFYGLAALPYQARRATLALLLGLTGLALSGAPAMATLFALGGAVLLLLDMPTDAPQAARGRQWAGVALAAAALAALLGAQVDAWQWLIGAPLGGGRDWRSIGRLLLWFGWPAWPLALWTVWRWRMQLGRRHVALPLWFALVAIGTTLSTPIGDRALLLGLPALAALAAFALPTFKRSAAAWVDWFTLLFFSGCALVIWVVWIAMQTGVPAKPAANVAKLAPGFEPSFGALAFVAALAATLAWGWLVHWRAGRNPQVIWKSLVLPAGGATLCWLLLMTLWLPMLDYARSYAPVVRPLLALLDRPGCVEVMGLSRAQIAALRFHGGLSLQPADTRAQCPWLVVTQDIQPAMGMALGSRQWVLAGRIARPTDDKDNLFVYRNARSAQP